MIIDLSTIASKSFHSAKNFEHNICCNRPKSFPNGKAMEPQARETRSCYSQVSTNNK